MPNARLITLSAMTALGVLASSLLVANPAGADTSPSPSRPPSPSATAAPLVTAPGAPSIIKVVSGVGSGQLQVLYSPPVSDGGAPIVSYEANLDEGRDWWPCVGTDGTCTLTNLSNGTKYAVALRAVNAVGSGPASEPDNGTPTIPVGEDPDKPAKLPKPFVWTGVSFNAASNGLGVDGSRTKLGVGTLPALTFAQPVSDKRAAESHLTVKAVLANGKVKNVKGAWGWMSDKEAVFRPVRYWPGHATIMITSSLDRAVLGKTGKKYVVGRKTLARTWTFKTGRRLIAKVDGQKVRMNVYIDGKKVKTFPVSLGKSDWETRNGVKVISTLKEADKTYTSQSLGLGPEEEYSLDAPWNTRLTPTGEFIHTATWAYGRIGRYNGSHGCTNMREEDAKWIFFETIPGDVVEYKNTGGSTVQSWNGPGGLWNIPWDQWLKKSALGNGGLVDASNSTSSGGTIKAEASA
jgi:lipoprotein-anchoring transpeptidase ErfK/SrfK